MAKILIEIYFLHHAHLWVGRRVGDSIWRFVLAKWVRVPYPLLGGMQRWLN